MSIRIDDTGFHASVADLRRACAEIASARSTADHEVSTLLDGGWRGVAARSFGASFDEWYAAAGVVERDLRGIADVLVAVRSRIILVDDSVAASLPRVS
jgi:uncharacterized protein YukE